jgi:stearoyl-CoA desaturase (delta-9 desaturase)
MDNDTRIRAFHAGAFAALFFFSWKALAVALVLWWIVGGV